MLVLVSVRDLVSKSYDHPKCFRTTGEAIRAFEASCKEQKSHFAQNPADFVMEELGSFDELSGTIQLLEKPHLLTTAKQIVDALNN